MLKKYIICILILSSIMIAGCSLQPAVENPCIDGHGDDCPHESGILCQIMIESELYRSYNKRIKVSDKDVEKIDYIEIELVDGLPTKNNQSNFLPDGKYRYGTYDGMLLMYFNDDWRLLEKDSDFE